MKKLKELLHDKHVLQLEKRLEGYGYSTITFHEYSNNDRNGELDLVGFDTYRNSALIVEYKGTHSHKRKVKAKDQLRRGADYLHSLGVDKVYGLYVADNKVRELFKW